MAGGRLFTLSDAGLEVNALCQVEECPQRYAHRMATQIAVRIPDSALAAMDDAIRAGRFESRAAAVREGLQRLLHEEREREIAEDYRRAYTERPEEEAVGEAGLTLMAESIAELEKGSRNHP